MKKIIFIIAIMFLCTIVHAEMYSWTDENGVRHFSNKKPSTTNEIDTRHEFGSESVDVFRGNEVFPQQEVRQQEQKQKDINKPKIETAAEIDMDTLMTVFGIAAWLAVIAIIVYINRKQSVKTIFARIVAGFGILFIGMIPYLFIYEYFPKPASILIGAIYLVFLMWIDVIICKRIIIYWKIRVPTIKWLARIDRNKKIIFVFILIAVFMGLFPPWKTSYVGRSRGSGHIVEHSIGYHFFLSQPYPAAHVDYQKLFAQWGILALLGSASYLVLGKKQ